MLLLFETPFAMSSSARKKTVQNWPRCEKRGGDVDVAASLTHVQTSPMSVHEKQCGGDRLRRPNRCQAGHVRWTSTANIAMSPEWMRAEQHELSKRAGLRAMEEEENRSLPAMKLILGGTSSVWIACSRHVGAIKLGRQLMASVQGVKHSHVGSRNESRALNKKGTCSACNGAWLQSAWLSQSPQEWVLMWKAFGIHLRKSSGRA